MKTIILHIVIQSWLTSMVYSQIYSSITYDAGTAIEVQTGADICANDVFINGIYSGDGTICTGALPVSLSSFTYSTNKRNLTLMWITEWELNNSGFQIERASSNSSEGGKIEWVKIAFIPGKGTTNTANGYLFKDENLRTGRYKYRLKQIDYIGNYEFYELNEEVTIAAPGKFELKQNYPNPGNPNTKINFEIPVESKVTIKLYDILGKEVKTLLDEIKKADYYTIEINGYALASGVYFYRITASGGAQYFSKAFKMILVK